MQSRVPVIAVGCDYPTISLLTAYTSSRDGLDLRLMGYAYLFGVTYDDLIVHVKLTPDDITRRVLTWEDSPTLHIQNPLPLGYMQDYKLTYEVLTERFPDSELFISCSKTPDGE